MIPIREASVDRHVYIKLMDSQSGSLMQAIADEVGDPLFQQDSAKVHTAHDTIVWRDENGINLEDHPHLSPDLNPIEHA